MITWRLVGSTTRVLRTWQPCWAVANRFAKPTSGPPLGYQVERPGSPRLGTAGRDAAPIRRWRFGVVDSSCQRACFSGPDGHEPLGESRLAR